MPARPRAGLVVGESQLGLGGLERILARPAMALHPHQGLDRCAGRAPGGEERQISITEAAPDQQAARPQAGEVLVVFLRLKIGEFEISPVIQARSLGVESRRQALPGPRGEFLCVS